MAETLNDKLDSIWRSFAFFGPEFLLICGILLLIIAGFFFKRKPAVLHALAFLIFLTPLLLLSIQWPLFTKPQILFSGMAKSDQFSAYFKILFNISAILTVFLTWRNQQVQSRLSEYYTLLGAIMLGAHLLVMSNNFVLAFIALELISLSSYVLTGFAFDKPSSEGSLKYFVFGSVASAVMLYGFSLLYGLTGTLDFTSATFINALSKNSGLYFVGTIMATTGFLYKIAAAPLHSWSPDVYESAPIPIVAFFSVVPKLAGVAILTKFVVAITSYGQAANDWQSLLAIVVILTLTIGNFSALWQKHPKRLMAYSSIAQSGFLLVGVVAFLPQGLSFMLFYATIYVCMNYLVFLYLHFFEKKTFTTIASYAGASKSYLIASLCLLIGLLSLIGLPPTSGFTSKLLVFTSIWEAYQQSNKPLLLWLLIFGLLNTVVSLFYYLRIPYYAFIRAEESLSEVKTNNNTAIENFLGVILVIIILILFFRPDLLMGWINKINFVL